jgi:hypothetical protein
MVHGKIFGKSFYLCYLFARQCQHCPCLVGMPLFRTIG